MLLDEIAEAEAQMYAGQRELLKQELPLVEHLVGLHQGLEGLVKPSEAEITEALAVTLALLLVCRHRLLTACLALLRGSQSDAFTDTRLAIESGAFVRRVLLHPHLAHTWLNASDSSENYRNYRENFSSGKLFPKDNRYLRELYVRYDYCSKQSHPSLHALTGRLASQASSDAQTLRLLHFDLEGQPVHQVRATLLWVLDTHLGILKALYEAFQKLPGFDFSEWARRVADFESHLYYKKSLLKPLVDSPGDRDI